MEQRTKLMEFKLLQCGFLSRNPVKVFIKKYLIKIWSNGLKDEDSLSS